MIYKYRAISKFKPQWWEGFYLHSLHENKHFIVQDAVKSFNHEKTGGYSFAHFAEIDYKTLSISTGKLDVKDNEIFTGHILSEKWQVEVYISSSNTFMVKFHTNSKVNKPMTLNDWFRRRKKAGTIDTDGLIVGCVFNDR